MFTFYLILINALGFFFMLADKQKARKKKWRYSESFLLGVAAVGGSFGSLAGMLIGHHKTKKPNFSGGIPIMCLIHAALIILYIYTAK